MSEIRERLRIAWAALRGRSVMRGVLVTDGSVCVHGSLLMSGIHTGLVGCTIWTDGPVVIRGDGSSLISGNHGDGLIAEIP
jgi:hypothetical protein